MTFSQILGGLIAILSMSATAGQISGTVTGLGVPASTITFSEVSLANETPVTNQFAMYGASFSAGLFLYTPQPFEPLGFSGVGLAGFRYSGFCCTQGFTISFETPLSAAAFAAVSANNNVTFTALLGGQVIDSFSAAVGQGFFGFTGITFDQIQVQLGPSSNGGIAIDTLQLGDAATPEPSTFVLLFLPLAAGSFRVFNPRRGS